jgi:hypothetical protein
VRAGRLYRAKAESIVPFFKRYFLEVRPAFAVDGLSVALERGLPIGGLSFTNSPPSSACRSLASWGCSLHGRRKRLGEPWDFNLNDLRYDIGTGFAITRRWVGPLDVAWQMNPIPGLLIDGEQKRPLFPLQHRPGVLIRCLSSAAPSTSPPG